MKLKIWWAVTRQTYKEYGWYGRTGSRLHHWLWLWRWNREKVTVDQYGRIWFAPF